MKGTHGNRHFFVTLDVLLIIVFLNYILINIIWREGTIWFKHILFRRKGLGTAYNATMPSPGPIYNSLY